MAWQGAEAIVSQQKKLLKKDRIVKGYRHPELDQKLRHARTKREAKVLEKLRVLGIPVPELYDIDNTSLTIELIKGKPLRVVLDKNPVSYAKEVGILIGKMHAANIIHGDLTTSNMIVHPKKGIHLIDFGLSFFSPKDEDKAVDLHVLNKALEAKHHKHYPKVMYIVL